MQLKNIGIINGMVVCLVTYIYTIYTILCSLIFVDLSSTILCIFLGGSNQMGSKAAWKLTKWV